MKKILQKTGIALLILILSLLILPLIIPIPTAKGVVPVQQLADEDSLFVQVDDIAFHYKTAGSGAPPLVLLHGFGASVYSWREVMPALAEQHRVYAYDRLAFGLTERPTEWKGDNPYTRSASLAQLEELLQTWQVESPILIGNSAGGTLAIAYTLAHPDAVHALILVSPAVGNGGSPYSNLGWLLQTPQLQRIGPLLVRGIQRSGLELVDQAWHTPAKQPPDTLPLYTKPLQAENWDFALWQYSTASAGTTLNTQLSDLNLPVLVITGDDDRVVPTQSSIKAAGQIPNASLVVLPNCGHVPQEECPEAFLTAVNEFLDRLANQP